MSTCLYVYMSICLYVYMSICLSACMSACLHAYMPRYVYSNHKKIKGFNEVYDFCFQAESQPGVTTRGGRTKIFPEGFVYI